MISTVQTRRLDQQPVKAHSTLYTMATQIDTRDNEALQPIDDVFSSSSSNDHTQSTRNMFKTKTIHDAAHESNEDPSHLTQPGFLTRCRDYSLAQVLRLAWPLLMATANRWTPERLPDKVFSYPERPWLKLRLWFPPSLDPSSKKPTRTLFEVHGGGWLFGASTDVDHVSCHFADHLDCVVVSLDYRKTPRNQFPVGLEDLEWTIEKIFDDDTLCVDRHNAAAIGHSAGGNLVLCECRGLLQWDNCKAHI